MRAVRYHGPQRPFALDEVPTPQPRPGEVRVRIEAAGMCHTELHFHSGLLNLGVAPLTMGHEIAGVIDEVGAGVDAGRIGERVLVYYYAGCGTCEWCAQGDENLCGAPQAQFGFFHDGGYAEYIAVPSRNAVVLPEQISLEDAAPIGCGVTTAVHACNLADVKRGDVVVVYGIGTVGYGLVQVARHRGATVVGIGRSAAKLAHAQAIGAEHVIDASTTDDLNAAVRDLTDGRGADVVFEMVATTPTMTASTAMLAKRGRLVFIGYSTDAFQVHPIQLVINETVVTASVGNTLAELKQAVQLVADGVVQTRVERTLPLEHWQEGFDDLATGRAVGRIVLTPHRG